jgi:hypothetical protein
VSILLLLGNGNSGTGGLSTRQQFGDEAELWFDGQDVDSSVVSGGYQQTNNLCPPEDAWDHFVTDDDDYAVSEDYSPLGLTQYYGEDAELLDQDDDDQVYPDVDYQLISVVAAANQPPEDAWDWTVDETVVEATPTGYAQFTIEPQIEDPWEWWVTEDDDYVTPDDQQLAGIATYFGEDAELLDQDDDDQVIVDSQPQLQGDCVIEDGWDWWSQEDDDYAVSENYAPEGVLQYYGEDAELADQDDDDQVNVDAYALVDANPVICLEDPYDHWPTEDDDYVVIDDYALVENLNPVEDAYDHFVTDDDDQVDVVEFTLISVATTALQYFGEDAEQFDEVLELVAFAGGYQQQDVEPQIEDPWDWFVTDDDDWVIPDDYQLASTATYFGEDAELLDQDDDDQVTIDSQPTLQGDAPIEDGWDWWSQEDDDQVDAVELPQPAVLNPLLCVEDAYDHFLTDDADEYYVADDYEFPATLVVLLAGVAFGAGISFGSITGPIPQGPYLYDPRFFNNSNAWTSYRTGSGIGVWG